VSIASKVHTQAKQFISSESVPPLSKSYPRTPAPAALPAARWVSPAGSPLPTIERKLKKEK
jgi:hypothetical protein